MHIAIFINTPAQFHFYRQIQKTLDQRGIESTLLARDYGETARLFAESKLRHLNYLRVPRSKLGKLLTLPKSVLKARRLLEDLNVDLVTGFGVYDAYTAALLRVPCIVFTDSEPRVNTTSYSIQFKLFMPFVDAVITPYTFRDDLGPKHIRVRSLKELAYLHPKYFTPDQGVLQDLGLQPGERYAIVRLNAFDAVHDLSVRGFRTDQALDLVSRLEKHVRVFLSPEGNVPRGLEDHILPIQKDRIHHALHFADLLVTDTQTMATEAALLGTPVVRCNSFVGSNDMGNFIELEREVGVVWNFAEVEDAILRAESIVAAREMKAMHRVRVDHFISSCIDIADYMAWALSTFAMTPKLQAIEVNNYLAAAASSFHPPGHSREHSYDGKRASSDE